MTDITTLPKVTVAVSRIGARGIILLCCDQRITTIGSAADCSIRLDEDAGVEGLHAVIEVSPSGEVFLTPREETKLNGFPLGCSTKIGSGAVIAVGLYELRVHFEEVEQPQDPKPQEDKPTAMPPIASTSIENVHLENIRLSPAAARLLLSSGHVSDSSAAVIAQALDLRDKTNRITTELCAYYWAYGKGWPADYFYQRLGSVVSPADHNVEGVVWEHYREEWRPTLDAFRAYCLGRGKQP